MKEESSESSEMYWLAWNGGIGERFFLPFSSFFQNERVSFWRNEGERGVSEGMGRRVKMKCEREGRKRGYIFSGVRYMCWEQTME